MSTIRHHPLGDGEGISVDLDASEDDRSHARGHRYWRADPNCETCHGSGILPVDVPTHAHDLKACDCVGVRVAETPSGSTLKVYDVRPSVTAIRLIFHNSREFIQVEISDNDAAKLHALLAKVIDPWREGVA